MAYIGKSIESGTFSVLNTSGNTYNGSNTTFNLGTQVGSVAQLLVSHDGVIQKPGTDYTLASGGTQITFTTAPASGASIFIVEISGAVGGTITPSDTSVTADKLNTALLTGHTDIGANIADADLFLVDDGAGGTLRKTAASRLKTYTAFSASDITGATALAEAPADTDEFIISDAGTLKRIDYSYIKGGTNTPYFQSSITSTQTLSNDVTTKVNFDRADVDSASGYSTTNKRYTIPSGQGGYWHIGYHVDVFVGGDLVKSAIAYPYRNGSSYPNTNSRSQGVAYFRMDGNPMRHCMLEKSFIANYSAGDYIELFVNLGHTNGAGNTGGAHEYYSIFWGYKLAGA